MPTLPPSLAVGSATSASMQRTLPPPMRSIVATSAVTSRPCRSSARRVAAASERNAAADNAITGPLAPSSSSTLPAKLSSSSFERSMISRCDASRRATMARRSAASRDGGRAERGEARAEREHDVRVIDRPARAVDGRERHDLVAELPRELRERVARAFAARGMRTPRAVRGRAPCCRFLRDTRRAFRAP